MPESPSKGDAGPLPAATPGRRLLRWGRTIYHAPELLANFPPVRRLRDRFGALTTLRWLALIVGLGLSIRILLAPFTAQTDIETYAESATSMAYGGSMYTYLTVYPPGWIYLVNLVGRTTALFVPTDGILVGNVALYWLYLLYGPIFPSMLNVIAFTVLEKSILFLSDLAMSGLLYAVVLETTGSARSARFAFALWFLNPLVITVSAVHGAFDGLPAFFALGAVYLMVRGYAFSSGASLAAGVLLKIFPAFLFGVILAVAWARCGRNPRALLREAGPWAAGFGGMALLALWPPGVLVPYVVSLTTGPSIGAPFGGFWIYSLTQLPSAAGDRAWLFQHSSLVLSIGALSTILLLAAIAILFLRRVVRTDALDIPIVYAALASQLIGYSSLGVVQPQYLLWSMPWLVLASCLDRRLQLVTLWVSSLPLVFYAVGLEGPYDLFLPVAQFTGWLSYATVRASVAAWQTEISVVRMVTTIAVFAVLVYALRRALGEFLRVRRSPA